MTFICLLEKAKCRRLVLHVGFSLRTDLLMQIGICKDQREEEEAGFMIYSAILKK